MRKPNGSIEDTLSCGSSLDAREKTAYQKQSRLVDWIVKLMLEDIKKIVSLPMPMPRACFFFLYVYQSYLWLSFDFFVVDCRSE